MSDEHLILCGGAGHKASRRGRPDVLRLDTDARRGSVNLRIGDISRQMVANLPDVATDLIEIAAYVYCADQAITRGGSQEIKYGKKWRRSFRFEIPVRMPEVWSAQDVRDELIHTLGFLSDDDYEFSFTKLTRPAPFQRYLELSAMCDQPPEVDEVLLFSGGLDSLGGAVQRVLQQKKKVALVSHRSVGKISRRQRDLVSELAQRVGDPKLKPLHVPVLINKDKTLGREYTQRSRSFLYASLAAVVARIFRLDRIRFYENGVTSLNLPICAQVIGARATRTTHPKVLRGLGSLFSLLFDCDFLVENPFLWKTKTDVISEIRQAGYGDLCRHTVSCMHTWEMTTLHTHCGRCSQCIDRRLSALAAGAGTRKTLRRCIRPTC